jgi:transcriptional regulator with PAS, ATPase and Fis domain
VLGFSCETILGKGNSFQEVLESKTPIVEKEMYIDINGNRKAFQGTIKPIFGQDSHILGALGIIKQNNKNGNYLKKEKTSMKAQYEFDDVIGNSMAMQQAVRLAQETAKMENNVLIQGESGTGKEVFAQAIHNANPEKDRPFVALIALPYRMDYWKVNFLVMLEELLQAPIRMAAKGSLRSLPAGRFSLMKLIPCP